MKINTWYIIFLIIFMSCKPQNVIESKNSHLGGNDIKDNRFWEYKDYKADNVPGISLDKWYASNKNTSKKDIIVAVIDTQLDIEHEDLKGQIWINTKEIPNNKIDDDKNGYVDDINGWNFIGTKSGNYTVWSNFEYVRIIKKFDANFKNKLEGEIQNQDLANFKEYKRANKMLNKNIKFYKNWLKSLKHGANIFPLVKDTLKHFFPKEDYTYNQLDSLYKIYKINDKTYNQRRDDNDKDLGALIDYMMVNLEINHKSFNDIKEQEIQVDSIFNKNLNIDYNERFFIGDNENVLEKGYGNNKINAKIKGIRVFNDHNTKVSGIIASNRNNNIGTKGFSNNIKIMPLTISPSGDEHDKDIAMAIKYAVDNGAKIVNMSFSKEFSLHPEWVFEALKYANEKNVLVVHCASNDSYDIDINPCYPNDNDYINKDEVSNNFINVGSISSKLDSMFVSRFSNYGKQNVDLFAPGDDIYTTVANNKYEFDGGTSLSTPMVSGTAALIWLYYPKLTASQVKQIILDSGTAYDIEVIVPGTKDKKVKFSELSKSGKVLNVYNAMKMAEEYSKKKKNN